MTRGHGHDAAAWQKCMHGLLRLEADGVIFGAFDIHTRHSTPAFRGGLNRRGERRCSLRHAAQQQSHSQVHKPAPDDFANDKHDVIRSLLVNIFIVQFYDA